MEPCSPRTASVASVDGQRKHETQAAPTRRPLTHGIGQAPSTLKDIRVALHFYCPEAATVES